MNKFKISVIIPTYNTGNLLKNCFDSIKSQTIGFDSIEVIFVDDASSDNYTLDLIKSYVSDFDNCNAIFLDENSGFPGKPRNIGLKHASADFVIFSDHDDSYEIDTFEVLYNNIKSESADIAICNFYQVFENNKVPFKSIFKNESKIIVDDIDENKDILRIPAAIWTRLFRKNFIFENNIYFLEGMLAEDVYFAVKSSLNGKVIYLNDFYGYNYNIRDSENNKSTINIRNKKYIEAMLNGYLKISKMLKETNNNKYSDYIYKSHLTSWLYTIVISNLNSKEKEELFKKSRDLFVKRYVKDSFFNGKYDNLVKFIQDGNIVDAIYESEKLKLNQTNINSSLRNNKIKGYLYKIIDKLK